MKKRWLSEVMRFDQNGELVPQPKVEAQLLRLRERARLSENLRPFHRVRKQLARGTGGFR